MNLNFTPPIADLGWFFLSNQCPEVLAGLGTGTTIGTYWYGTGTKKAACRVPVTSIISTSTGNSLVIFR